MARLAYKRVGQDAPRRHHGLKERLLVFHGQHQDEAPRLKLKAFDELAGDYFGGARAVELDHRVALGGLEERAVGLRLVHLGTSKGGVADLGVWRACGSIC